MGSSDLGWFLMVSCRLARLFSSWGVNWILVWGEGFVSALLIVFNHLTGLISADSRSSRTKEVMLKVF